MPGRVALNARLACPFLIGVCLTLAQALPVQNWKMACWFAIGRTVTTAVTTSLRLRTLPPAYPALVSWTRLRLSDAALADGVTRKPARLVSGR